MYAEPSVGDEHWGILPCKPQRLAHRIRNPTTLTAPSNHCQAMSLMHSNRYGACVCGSTASVRPYWLIRDVEFESGGVINRL